MKTGKWWTPQWKSDDAENRERPHVSLEHAPGAPAVLDVGEVEEVGDHLDGRAIPQGGNGSRLHDLVQEEQIHDGGREQDDAPKHQRIPIGFASIADWHSMHVWTNGRFRRRGLRMSCPQISQMP